MNSLEKYRITHKREIEEIDEIERLCIQIDVLAESVGYYSKKKQEELDKYLSSNDNRAYEQYLKALTYEDSARKELVALQLKFDQYLKEKGADYPPQIVALCYLPDLSILPENLQNMVKEARSKLGISVGEELNAGDSKPKQQGEE